MGIEHIINKVVLITLVAIPTVYASSCIPYDQPNELIFSSDFEDPSNNPPDIVISPEVHNYMLIHYPDFNDLPLSVIGANGVPSNRAHLDAEVAAHVLITNADKFGGYRLSYSWRDSY